MTPKLGVTGTIAPRSLASTSTTDSSAIGIDAVIEMPIGAAGFRSIPRGDRVASKSVLSTCRQFEVGRIDASSVRTVFREQATRVMAEMIDGHSFRDLAPKEAIGDPMGSLGSIIGLSADRKYAIPGRKERSLPFPTAIGDGCLRQETQANVHPYDSIMTGGVR